MNQRITWQFILYQFFLIDVCSKFAYGRYFFTVDGARLMHEFWTTYELEVNMPPIHLNPSVNACATFAGLLTDGEYVIQTVGGVCSGKYLSYKPYGKQYPDVVRLKSSWAKRQPIWVIRQARPDVFTIEAEKRAKGYPAKLGYTFADKGTNVYLSDMGRLSWEILPQGRTGQYLIVTHVCCFPDLPIILRKIDFSFHDY